jgi:hypothetical protein
MGVAARHPLLPQKKISVHMATAAAIIRSAETKSVHSDAHLRPLREPGPCAGFME